MVMVGDGITDLEAVQVTGGADLFIGCVRVEDWGLQVVVPSAPRGCND